MIDELRSPHDDPLAERRRDWVASDAYALLGRVMLAIGVALMVGVSASALVERYAEPSTATSSSKDGSRKPATPASSR